MEVSSGTFEARQPTKLRSDRSNQWPNKELKRFHLFEQRIETITMVVRLVRALLHSIAHVGYLHTPRVTSNASPKRNSVAFVAKIRCFLFDFAWSFVSSITYTVRRDRSKEMKTSEKSRQGTPRLTRVPRHYVQKS